MAEKLAQAIEKAITFCEKVEISKQINNIEIVVTGYAGTKKQVWLPISDHLDRMADYIEIIVNDIWEEEQDKKKRDGKE